MWIAGVCTLPMEAGPCKAGLTRWYYNTESRRCQEFDYGGCEGNANRFETAAQCQDVCGDPDQETTGPSLKTTGT